MLKKILAVLSIAMCISLLPFNESKAYSTDELGDFKVVGYFPDWYGDVVNQIQFDKLTHINYAFALPNPDGTIIALNNPSVISKLITTAHQNNVKVLIALGGWSGNDGQPLEPTFVAATNTDAKCQVFANNVLAMVDSYGFDGVDVDWEHPTTATAPQYERFMGYLKAGLVSRGKYLSAAVVGCGSVAAGQTDNVLQMLDWVNVMAYDGGSGAEHSPYSYAVQSGEYWLARGVEKNKVILGVPFYERPNWAGYSTIISYNSSYAYTDTAVINGTTVYYNGINTIREKTTWAGNNAGGVMIWHLLQDTSDQNLSLLNTIYNTAKGFANTVSEPINISNGTKIEAEDYTTNLGVDTEMCSEGGINVGWFDAGDYIDYKINVTEVGKYTLDFRAASPDGNVPIYVYVDGNQVSSATIGATGDWQVWNTYASGLFDLSSGSHTIRIYAQAGGSNLNYFTFKKASVGVVDLSLVTAYQDINYGGTAASIGVGTYTTSQMIAKGINDNDISSIRVPSGYKVTLYKDDNFGGESLVLTEDLNWVGNDWNDQVSSIKVEKVIVSTAIAVSNGTRIEAENYTTMIGVQTENCEEGGTNVGYMDAGDSMDYLINVASAGTYAINFRSASPDGNVVLHIYVDNVLAGNVAISATGGWQVWQTFTSSAFALTAGEHTLRIYMQTSGSNLNYITFNTASNQTNGLQAYFYQYSQGTTGYSSSLDYDYAYVSSTTVNNVYYNDIHSLLNTYAQREDGVGVRFVGQIKPNHTGTYKFSIIGDNGFKLSIGGVDVINNWEDNWDVQKSGTVYLEANKYYNIQLDYFENYGGAYIKLEWDENGTNVAVPSNVLFMPNTGVASNAVIGVSSMLSASATASAVETSDFLASYAVDNNAQTRWSSDYSDNANITLDLGSVKSIDKIILNWEAAYGSAYQIQVSNNGSTWTTVYTTYNGVGGIENLNIATSARYVRMQGITRALPYGYSLYEFEVYGS